MPFLSLWRQACRLHCSLVRSRHGCHYSSPATPVKTRKTMKSVEPFLAFQLKSVLFFNSKHMKEKSRSPSAFPSLQVPCLFVFLAGAFLAMFATAVAQPRGVKPAQRQNVKTGVVQPGQNFWAQTNGPQGGDGIALTTNVSGHIFVGTQGGGIFRSTDNGETWTGVNSGLTATNVRALAISPTGQSLPERLAESFVRRTTGIAGLRSTMDWNFQFVISLSINSDGDIFAGTFEGGGVYRSTDDGDNWTLIDNGLTNTYVTASGNKCQRRHLCCNLWRRRFSFHRQRRQLDRTQQREYQMPTFLSLAINASGYIFAGGDPLGGPVGVPRSTDNGDSWSQSIMG